MNCALVTERESGCSPSQRPINRPGWWKGKFALFQMLANVGGQMLATSVQRPAPPGATSGARAFIDGRRGLHTETAQSALTVSFKLVMGCRSGSPREPSLPLPLHFSFPPEDLPGTLRIRNTYSCLDSRQKGFQYFFYFELLRKRRKPSHETLSAVKIHTLESLKKCHELCL